MYDAVMTGVSSTCIVHMFLPLFPPFLSTLVVANGVWSAWDGYGLLFTLVSGSYGRTSGVLPSLYLYHLSHLGDGLYTVLGRSLTPG
jgi:hypothetical protein